MLRILNKSSLFSALLFLLVCSFSYGEVTLSDEEYILLMNSLERAQNSILESNEALKNSQENAKHLGKTIELLNQQISLYNLNWNMQLESSELQKKDLFLEKLKWFMLGTATGTVAGGAGGIKIGVLIAD